jgi:hypothetical protein
MSLLTEIKRVSCHPLCWQSVWVVVSGVGRERGGGV